MVKIRSCCFETNSSSTHCLVIPQDVQNASEDAFDKQYIVYPFSDYDIYSATYTTIEDKLRYFLTIYYQGDDTHTYIMRMLTEMFPNALFIRDFKVQHTYILEDAEYYREVFRPTYEELKDFMLNGVVYFGDRNNEDFYEFTHYDVKKNSRFYCCWSG